MKNVINNTYTILLVFTSIVSCSNDDTNNTEKVAQCSNPDFIMEISDKIPATVSVVAEGEPFFHGIRTFYEVDAEKNLPDLFDRNGQKTIRIFPVEKANEILGENIGILGRLNSCLTSDHGLLTNDYKVFYILER